MPGKDVMAGYPERSLQTHAGLRWLVPPCPPFQVEALQILSDQNDESGVEDLKRETDAESKRMQSNDSLQYV